MSDNNDEKEKETREIVEESTEVVQGDLAAEDQMNGELWVEYLSGAKKIDESVSVERGDETLVPFVGSENVQADPKTVEEPIAVEQGDLGLEDQMNDEEPVESLGGAEKTDEAVRDELEDETSVPSESPKTVQVDHVTELENQCEEQKSRVIQSARAVAIRRQRLETNREKRDRVRENLAHLTTGRDSLGSWLQERSQSLALKLLAHIDQQEKNLESEERVIRGWAEAPIPVTVDTAANLRKKYIIGLWSSLLAAILLPLLLFGLNILLKQVDLQVLWFEDVWWRYTILGVCLLLIFTLMTLAAYHRGYTRMKLEMDDRLSQGRYLLGAIDHIRTERARIEGLAPQVRDRLQFFGAVLQEPWRVPSYGGATEDSGKLSQGLPALLQIATTARTNDPTMIKLRAQFTAEQFRIGMRRQAIDELIRAAAERRGIPSEQADLNVIDRDSAAHGLRAALFDMVRDPDVLEQVGKRRVTEIASYIQDGMSPSGERPSIALTNIDTLQGLSLNNDLLADWSMAQTSWDEYLTEILEDGAALSRLAFSPTGTAQSRHLKFQSIAIAPERLREKTGQLIEFVEVDSRIVTGAEIVARLDITPAMEVSDVALFEETISDGWSQYATDPNLSSTVVDDDDSYTL